MADELGREEQTSRRDFSGWLRLLGFKQWRLPAVPWTAQHVILIKDERDLASFDVGPRAIFGGSIVAGALNRPALQILAGAAGCRFGLHIGWDDAAGVEGAFGAKTFAVGSQPALTASLPLTLWPSDTDAPPLSRTIVGDITGALSDAYQFHLSDAPEVAGHRFPPPPLYWLAPGRVFHLQVNQPASTGVERLRIAGYLEENASPIRSRP